MTRIGDGLTSRSEHHFAILPESDSVDVAGNLRRVDQFLGLREKTRSVAVRTWKSFAYFRRYEMQLPVAVDEHNR